MAAPTGSIEKLQKKLEKEPNSLIFLQLADEYRKEGEYDDALRTCREGLRRHPTYWSARVAMGRIYHEMGDLNKSRDELEKVIKAVPDNLLANKLLGDIYLELQRFEEALKRYKIVQMLTPNDQEVIANISKIETRLSGPSAAAPKAEPVPPAPFAALPEVQAPPQFDLSPQTERTPEPTVEMRPAKAEDVNSQFIAATEMPHENMWDPEPKPFSGDDTMSSSSRPVPAANVDLTGPMDIMTLPTFESDSEAQTSQDLQSEKKLVEDAQDFIPTNEPAAELDFSANEEKAETVNPENLFLSASVASDSNGSAEELWPNVIEEEKMDPADMEPMILEPVIEEPGVVARNPEDRTQPMAEEQENAPEPDLMQADEMTTQTLAELYESQGLVDKAVRVYQKLLLNNPNNTQIINKLKKLSPADALVSGAAREEKPKSTPSEPRTKTQPEKPREAVAAVGAPKYEHVAEDRRRKITTLESWLATIRRERQ